MAQEPTSPSADYGFVGIDSFDPSKYDFYNPEFNATCEGAARMPSAELSHPKAENVVKMWDGAPVVYDQTHQLATIEEQDDHTQAIPKMVDQSSTLPSSQSVRGSSIGERSNGYIRQQRKQPLTPEYLFDYLFSRRHLLQVLHDLPLAQMLQAFIIEHEPTSVPLLARLKTLMKALQSIIDAQDIVKGLDRHDEDHVAVPQAIQNKIEATLDDMARGVFRTFVIDLYRQIVVDALGDQVSGKPNPVAQALHEVGLAEAFVLADPTRPDHPLIFASDDFQYVTGYERSEMLSHNLFFLGEAKVDSTEVQRFRQSLENGKAHSEILLNRRRDGSAFIDLVMSVPLHDQSGKLRYQLGAHVDLTYLVRDHRDARSLCGLLSKDTVDIISNERASAHVEGLIEDGRVGAVGELRSCLDEEELRALATLQLQNAKSSDNGTSKVHGAGSDPGRPTTGPSVGLRDCVPLSGLRKSGAHAHFYEKYLLIRPYPSLRVLFASPGMATRDIIQSPLMSLVDGSTRVREHLMQAIERGRKVTAKVKWLPHSGKSGTPHWIHCTPLLSQRNKIDVWIIILVSSEDVLSKETRQVGSIDDASKRQSIYDDTITPWEADKLSQTSMSVVRQDLLDGSPSRTFSTNSFSHPTPQNLSGGETVISLPSSGAASSKGGLDVARKGDLHRPTPSQGSALQETDIDPFMGNPAMSELLRPQIRTLRTSSEKSERSRESPIKYPGPAPDKGDDASSTTQKRTYKSLSPYGVLF